MAVNACGISAAESNRTAVRYVAEDPNCWAVTPVTVGTKTRELRITSSSITANKETQVSEEIRADRMVPSIIEVGASAEGDIEGEFSAGTYDDFMQAYLLGTWTKAMTFDFFKGVNVSFVANNQLTVSGDQTAYFVVGRTVKTEGFALAQNNNYWAISAVAFASGVTTLTFTETTAAAEAGNSFSRVLDANDVILRSTAVRLGTGGASVIDSNGGNAFSAAIAAKQLVVGMRIHIAGLGYESATLTMTGQPADGDTLTLNDGEKAVVIEFDSNGAFIRGRTAVTIGVDADATATATAAAINALYANKKTEISAKVDLAGADALVVLYNRRDEQGGTVTESMANAITTAFAGGVAANHGFFTVTSLTSDVIGVSPNPGINANAGSATIVVKGSHVRNPGVLSEIIKQSFTVETGFTDVGQYMVTRGQRVGGFNMSVSSGEIATVSFAMMGKDMTTRQTTLLGSAPYVAQASTATEPLNATVNVGEVRKNGEVLNVALQSIDLEGDAGLRQQTAVGSKYAAGIGYGRMSMSGTMNVYFETLEMYDHFLNHDTISLAFDFKDADNNVYTFTLPAVKLASDPIAPGGIDADILEEIEFVTQRDPVLNTQFMIDRFSSIVATTA